MKVSFIVPCRNKAAHVARTVATVLDQTYQDMEIVLSDQGSTDGTFEILKGIERDYTGNARLRILQCPETQFKGMAGLNAHLNWLHKQIEGDIVIMCSADDLNHIERVEHTVQAFKEFNPSYVGTCVEYYRGNMEFYGLTKYTPENGWVDPIDNVRDMVGSSASSAWSRDLYEKYFPMYGVESQDVLLPFFASIERGIYYVAKPLHAYIEHASEENTGLQGVMRAAKTDDERMAMTEAVNYHYTSNFFAIMRRLNEMKIEIDRALETALFEKAIDGASGWALARDAITLLRIEPKAMRV